MEFERLNWTILDRLRAGFLSGSAAAGPYWQTDTDLDLYDATYGERIGWKWDTLLAELARRSWSPSEGPLLDWGCGSGVAGRRVVAQWPDAFRSLAVWDHSPLARDYAARRLRRSFPGHNHTVWQPGQPVATLVLSHVLTEMNEAQLRQLQELVESAQCVLWIEPGTKDVGRTLARLRDLLRERFTLIGPCTHAQACPLFAPANERHWCHFFALPPKGIYADSNWVRFGQRAGIDLRSLPYSCLVLQKGAAPAPLAPDAGRVLGRVDLHKAHAAWLHCDASGLHDVKLTKRAAPDTYKALDRRPGLPLLAVTRDGDGQVTGAQELFPRDE